VEPCFSFQGTTLYLADCLSWLRAAAPASVHGVITDPPFGLEYTAQQQQKLRRGQGGMWREPPRIGGSLRQPLPRFTALTSDDRNAMRAFFAQWAVALFPVLVPGAHVLIASSTLFEPLIAHEMAAAGFDRRGAIVRLVRTFRGGDRPKAAEDEFPMVTVIPRSCWEPWGLYRKPFDGTVADCLRQYGTGGLRRISEQSPFGDVIRSQRTPAAERAVAEHPSLKPQAFLRELVRAVLPCERGTILDPFAGSGSTLAACIALGAVGIGVERDRRYFALAKRAIPKLARL